MEYKLKVFLFLVMTFECNGHLPILGNILSTAHKQIQSGVESVAGAVLGGVNFNLGGFVDFNRRNNPENVPQKGSDETIVIVVEEPGNSDYGNTNNYHPNHNAPPPPYHNERPPLHFDSGRPLPPPHHHHHTPHGYPRPGYNDQNQGNYHHNEQGISQDSGNLDNGNYFYGNNQNSRPYNNNNGNFNNNEYQPYPTDTQEHQKNNNNQKNIYDGHTTLFSDSPTTEYVKTADPTKVSPISKDEEVNNATERSTKSSDDLPLFVPLSPDEYVYGGDRINITAPKRDTDKTKQENSDDDDFAIDIRLKDE